MIEIISSIVGTALVGVCANIYFKLKKEKNKMSFQESIDLIELPIVCFKEGDRKLNFLLDTGSNDSHITEKASKGILGTPIDYNHTFIGSAGEGESSKKIDAVISYRNKEFKEEFIISKNLDISFDIIKAQYGIRIDGILGSKFFQKNKYVLDFKSMTAYIK